MRGVIKEIVSGDTVVIAGGAPKGQIPPEKRLTLASLIAPKLVRRNLISEPAKEGIKSLVS
jgi:staphylococcal nuclease domain-containing protein 1